MVGAPATPAPVRETKELPEKKKRFGETLTGSFSFIKENGKLKDGRPGPLRIVRLQVVRRIAQTGIIVPPLRRFAMEPMDRRGRARKI